MHSTMILEKRFWVSVSDSSGGKTQVKPTTHAARHPILHGVDMDGWESQGTLYLIDAQPGIEPLLIGTGHSKRGYCDKSIWSS